MPQQQSSFNSKQVAKTAYDAKAAYLQTLGQNPPVWEGLTEEQQNDVLTAVDAGLKGQQPPPGDDPVADDIFSAVIGVFVQEDKKKKAVAAGVPPEAFDKGKHEHEHSRGGHSEAPATQQKK